MKTPEQNTKYRAGFAVRAVLLALLAVGCLAACCSVTYAWFITARGTVQNALPLAEYSVAVKVGGTTELPGLQYTCPLTAGDQHSFTLTASGTADSGHCIITVADPLKVYEVDLNPGQSCAVNLQAAENSVVTFAYDWGKSENPVNSTAVFGSENTIAVQIAHSRTDHLPYDVVYGATPAGIAAYYGVNVEDLCTYNGLDLAAAATPIYPKTKLTYNIPYVKAHPSGLAYVPKGNLVVTLVNAGDAAVPESTIVLVSGPNNYVETIPYSQFTRNIHNPEVASCLLNNLPAGDYCFALGNVELANYTLVTNGIDEAAAVHENATTQREIKNTYTRHKGDLKFDLKPSDAKVTIPADAKLIFFGPDGNFEVAYSQFVNGSVALTQLPTGQYTVVLNKGDVKYYDLVKSDTTLTIAQDKTTEHEMVAEYQRQIGSMKLLVTASGHEIPDGAYVAVIAYDGSYFEVPCASFVNGVYTKDGVLAGDYMAQLASPAVDGYDLNVPEVYFTVEKEKVTETTVTVEYKRHQGNVGIEMTVEGNTVPAAARVILTDANGVSYETYYMHFLGNCFTLPNLPTGEYTVKLEDAGIAGYDLSVEAENVTVKKGEEVIAPIKVKYTRQMGVLTITVSVNNAELALPATAVMTITGPDTVSTVACVSCQLADLPTGTYTVSVSGVDLEGYTVTAEGGSAELTKEGATINVSIVYTAAETEKLEQMLEDIKTE